jgi:hypothetical protein
MLLLLLLLRAGAAGYTRLPAYCRCAAGVQRVTCAFQQYMKPPLQEEAAAAAAL